jgi:hypothetical protein
VTGDRACAFIALALLFGCAAPTGPAPSPSAPPPPLDREGSAAASPLPSPSPSHPHAPSHPPSPEADSRWARLVVGGRRLAASVGPTHDQGAVLSVTLEGGERAVLVHPTGFIECGETRTALDPVEGAPRLVLAQAFCEQGEDELSRDVVAMVIDVGEAARPPRILWNGRGSFRSSFGRCDHIDVPEVRGVAPGKAEVVRWTEVISRPNPERLGGGDCRPQTAKRVKVADLAY